MFRLVAMLVVTAGISVVANAQPAAQIEFEKLRASLPKQYKAADTQMRKSAVFQDASQRSVSAIQAIGGAAKNWRGKLVELTTDQGGEAAYIVIESEVDGFKVQYRTWNNFLS